jgi:hypothetical protein
MFKLIWIISKFVLSSFEVRNHLPVIHHVTLLILKFEPSCHCSTSFILNHPHLTLTNSFEGVRVCHLTKQSERRPHSTQRQKGLETQTRLEPFGMFFSLFLFLYCINIYLELLDYMYGHWHHHLRRSTRQ